MLAQNFKTADELQITDEERSALIKVLGMFEREEIQPSTPYKPNCRNGFHMATVRSTEDCKTVACIKGWCQIVGGNHLFDPFNGRPIPPRLYDELFLYGDERRKKINSPDQAAAALRSYLTTGRARWNLALGT